MTNKQSLPVSLLGVLLSLAVGIVGVRGAEPVSSDAAAALERIAIQRGVCAVLGLPNVGARDFVKELAAGSKLLVYFQSPDPREVARVRETAEAAGLLGNRVFVARGDRKSIHLADNLAGAVLVAPSARVAEEEILRVLHPAGRAVLGARVITKPVHPGIDNWTHPYHAPDNNPQSTDQLARAPYLTQFIAGPKFSPMPEVTVAAAGRIFKAFGHIAHKANQNPVLNTLLCVNAYNGEVLWKRDLKEGFMIHRNAMIATPETLYLGDQESCKLIDTSTGKVRDQIVVPQGITDGPVWKWMALEGDTLYALVGGQEAKIFTQPSDTRGLGHWPWGMWPGHDYGNPESSFGFGRTFVAIDPSTKKIRWSHREEEYIDSRGVCMKNGRIYYYSPEKFLACLDAKESKVIWKTSDPELLGAIGPNGRAQHYVTGYATTTYIKCNDRMIFFAGPQRSRLVVVRAEDGELLWQKRNGNLQLVLRDDGFYAAGPGGTGAKLDYETGEELVRLPRRRACTRATGSVDSVFFRTPGGTVRIHVPTNTAKHIAPMRPPCQDGVIISDGLLYWGPWMCGCQLSLYGHIALGPAGDFNYRPPADGSRLESGPGDTKSVESFTVEPGDWPTYRGDNRRSAVTEVGIPRRVRELWRFQPSSPTMPTAPVVAGGTVFAGDRGGVLRALDRDGRLRWKAHTGGALYYPPALAQARAYVGSADGWVYAFEAASGRQLWRFRVGPAERRIPVFGKLISTWPVAGGVVVEGGVVYAAAGIAHYDSTHVVALDGVTGEVKWYNNSSGTISEQVDSGISLQGELYVDGGELRFLGGGVYHTARYDLKTGRCRNEPHHDVNSRFQTAFYPYYPQYGQYVSLHHTFPDGKTLNYAAAYEGSRHSSLALLAPESAGSKSGEAQRRGPQRKALWERPGRRYHSLIVAPGVLLAAGHVGDDESRDPFLAAIDVGDGSDIWTRELPAPAVKGGTAVDHEGRIIVSLKDGRVLCFTAGKRVRF